MPASKAPLRAQHAPGTGADAHARTNGHREPQSAVLGRVRSAGPGLSVRVTVRLGLAPNALAFWRRRRYGTAVEFARALTGLTGLHVTPAYVRYWEAAVGVPPPEVVEAVALLLELPPTLIWTQDQLR